jgi:predicted MFS family arabinose efflux permease
MSFSIFRIKTVAGANASGLILGTAVMSMFLMLTLYMQQVLHFSPMKAGVSYLAVALSVIVWSAVASQLVTKVGVKPVLVTGMIVLTIGLLYFTRVSVDGSYVGDLLPGFLVIALGMGFSFVPISIAALAGVEAADAGLASGLINTSQQIGGALGIAVLSSVAVAHTTDAARAGARPAEALTAGFHAAFWIGAAIAAAGAAASLLLVRRDELERVPAEALPIPA